MAVNPAEMGVCPQYELADGTPAVGNRLFFYVAGSVGTKQNTYTDSTGGSANTNPITLNALGMPSTEIWWTAGQSYKVVYAPPGSDDPPNSPIKTWDNLLGINDTTSSQSEWVSGPAPTYVSATSFTLVGDQTTTFAKSRRVKATVTAGTVYGTITSSTFGATTTIVVAIDSGSLDSGLSAISYGLVAAANPSINADLISRKGTAVASAATTDIWGIAGDFVHITGVVTITSLGTAPYAGTERTIIFDGILTLTHNATTLQLPGALNITTAAGDRAIVRADTTANMIVVDYVRAAARTPTRQVLLSGTSATYTTAIGATRLHIRMAGGGAGSGGSAPGTSGGNAGDSSFNAITAKGATGGTVGTGSANAFVAGGAGGTGGAGSASVRIPGQNGGAGQPYNANYNMGAGGAGGNSPFGGAGASPAGSANGQAAATNSGSGASGASINSGSASGGGGGGAGEYVEIVITSPAATYTYSVGTAGAAGTGTIQAGAAGAAGIIIVDEFYT